MTFCVLISLNKLYIYIYLSISNYVYTHSQYFIMCNEALQLRLSDTSKQHPTCTNIGGQFRVWSKHSIMYYISLLYYNLIL